MYTTRLKLKDTDLGWQKFNINCNYTDTITPLPIPTYQGYLLRLLTKNRAPNAKVVISVADIHPIINQSST